MRIERALAAWVVLWSVAVACGEPETEGAPRRSTGDKSATAAQAKPKEKPTKAKPAQAEPAQVEAPKPEAKAEGGRAPEPSIAEAEVRALLEQWLSAQNRRKLADYEALYAPELLGVKRSGPRVYRYDRAGWIRDRGAMFRKPMKVEALDVSVTTSARQAVIGFEQHFESGRYKDRGRKRIVVVKTPDGLRIASEVMLASELLEVADATGLSPLPPARFMFALQADATYLVLQPQADASLATGAPSLAHDGEAVSVLRAVDAERLSPELRALQGAEVQLYTGGGVACKGRLAELELMRRVVPHFGTREYFRGSEGTPPLSREAIAEASWELGSERTLLVARLSEPSGDCKDALWGRAVSEPVPKLFTGATLTQDLAAPLVERVRALPAYKREQANCKAAPECAGGEWERMGGASPELLRWRGESRSYLSFFASVGESCGAYAGTIWALFEVMGEQLWPLTDGKDPGGLRPIAIFDADGDDLIEVLVGPELHRPKAAAAEPGLLLRQRADRGLQRGPSIEPVFLDCSC